jgi:ubiquinone/menaquinone biosynthesis C-methylase UbiE
MQISFTTKRKMINDVALAMKYDWNSRARENAKWYINCFAWNQSDEEFDSTGQLEVERLILTDHLLTKELPFKSQRLLEIGCGIGRMTRPMAGTFREVHAVDVSGEMIEQARERLRGFKNVYLHTSNGLDFSMFPNNYFDLIFAAYVFQHVPSQEVIVSNILDACRVLKPGGLFKFQTCAITLQERKSIQKDTWAGVEFPESSIRQAARDTGVHLISIFGVETQYCWSIFRKPQKSWKGMAVLGKPDIIYYGRADAPQISSVPVKGEQSSVTLIIAGMDCERMDTNNIYIQINDTELHPCYAGWLYSAYAQASSMHSVLQPENLTQINFQIPANMEKGKMSCRVRQRCGRWSEPIMVELLEPPPIIPKILLIDNAADGGGDVYAQGAKSLFRIFSSHMDATANHDSVRIILNEQKLKPQAVSLVPANGLYMTIVKMPEGMLPGETEVKIRFHDLLSAGYALHIRE